MQPLCGSFSFRLFLPTLLSGVATGQLALGTHGHLDVYDRRMLKGHVAGNPDTTIVSGERFTVLTPGTPSSQRIAPDLLISFNANPALYRQDNSYVISRQGKPPDLVMEIASRRTGEIDIEDKPARYAALAIPEYWRFDETGQFRGTKLAGDRLVDGQYEPVAIEAVEEGVLQGYSTGWASLSGRRTAS